MADYSVRAILSAVDQSFSSTLARAGQATQSFGSAVNSKMSGVGKAMTVAGAATTAMGVKAVKGFGDFQTSLNQAAVIAGGTSKNIGELADVANHMGAVLPISAQDAADAMVEMARNGASLDEIKKEFPAIAEASTAAGSDLSTTAGVVQQAMNIWGDSLKSPQQASAILVQTANASNASIEDMQQALATIGSTAKMAGMDMGTTSEAIGLLTNRGFSAAQASDDLNHAITQMLAPSSIAKKEMDALGLSFVDSSGKMKPFPTILKEIADKTNDMGEAQKTAALKAMFGASGMKAIAPLLDAINDKTGNAKTSWSAYAAEQDKAAGSTAKATKFLADQANQMQQNIGSKIEQVGGNWEALRNKAMAAKGGINGAMLDMMNQALEWSTTSNNGIAKVIRGFISLSPVIGPAMTAIGGFTTNLGKIIGVGGSVIGTIGNIGKVFIVLKQASNISSAITALQNLAKSSAIAKTAMYGLKAGQAIFGALGSAARVAMGGIQALWGVLMANPIVAVIVAITAVVAALVLFFTKTKLGRKIWGEFVQWLQNAWNSLKSTVGPIWDAIGQAITHPVETIKQLWQGIKDWFGQLWQGVIDTAKQLWSGFTQFFAPIVEAVKNTWSGIKDFFTQLWQGIIDNAKQLWQGFTEFFAPIISAIQAIWQPISEFFSNLWNTIKEFAGQVWQGIQLLITNPVQFIQNLWTNLTTFFSNLWNMIVQGAHAIWDTFAQIFAPIVDAIKNIWNGLTEFFSNLWNTIKNVTSNVWNGIKGFISNVWNGIKNTVSNGGTAVSNFVSNAMDKVKSFFSNGWNRAKSLASDAWNVIKSHSSNGGSNITNVVSNTMSRVGSAFSNGWNRARSATANGIREAVDVVKNYGSQMVSAGRNFVMGFVNGIRSMIGHAVAAAANMARSAVNAARSFLHIHSPSRVMRDQVGYYVAAGFAKGMTDNTNMVASAANEMAQSAIPSIDMSRSINGVLAHGNINNLVNGTVDHQLTVNQQPAYINLALGGSEYSTFVEDISREQGNQFVLSRNYRI